MRHGKNPPAQPSPAQPSPAQPSPTEKKQKLDVVSSHSALPSSSSSARGPPRPRSSPVLRDPWKGSRWGCTPAAEQKEPSTAGSAKQRTAEGTDAAGLPPSPPLGHSQHLPRGTPPSLRPSSAGSPEDQPGRCWVQTLGPLLPLLLVLALASPSRPGVGSGEPRVEGGPATPSGCRGSSGPGPSPLSPRRPGAEGGGPWLPHTPTQHAGAPQAGARCRVEQRGDSEPSEEDEAAATARP